MTKKHSDVRYVTDESGKKISVILDIEDYEAIQEKLEELDDILEYNRMKPLVDEDMREGRFYTLEEAIRKYGDS